MPKRVPVPTHALSYSGFAKTLNVKTETAQKYLDVLGDSFLLATIFSYDTSKARVALKKNRKFVWMDSSLAFLANATGQSAKPKIESLAEMSSPRSAHPLFVFSTLSNGSTATSYTLSGFTPIHLTDSACSLDDLPL